MSFVKASELPGRSLSWGGLSLQHVSERCWWREKQSPCEVPPALRLPTQLFFPSYKLQTRLPFLMKPDAHHILFHALINEQNRCRMHSGCFHSGRTDQSWAVPAHFLARLYYQARWWRMLYPSIDFPQVLILEIRRVLPSASSQRRTEPVKTPHNSFQKTPALMDYTLCWEWASTLIESTESVQ